MTWGVCEFSIVLPTLEPFSLTFHIQATGDGIHVLSATGQRTINDDDEKGAIRLAS